MQAHLKYLRYVLIHKWYVFRACLGLGVPLHQAIIHDWTKFTPAEWGPYVRRFGAGRGSQWEKDADPTEFHMAWKHHWTRNPHHWEYWLPEPICDSSKAPLEMPERYAREMVADWYGAGMAQGKPDIEAWFLTNGERMLLHDSTRQLVTQLIHEAKRKGLIP